MIGNLSLSYSVLVFMTALACLYVAGRLWTMEHENQYLREELLSAHQSRRALAESSASPTTADVSYEDADVLFYNARPRRGNVEPLHGSRLEDDTLPLQLSDGQMVGQVDTIQDGTAGGWACLRGMDASPLKVVVYVDSVLVGSAEASSADTRDDVRRLCQLDMNLGGEQGAPLRGVGWSLALPPLAPGKHELRAFMLKPGGGYKQELNQSPVNFAEVPKQVSLEEQLKRKDEIIRTRNIQIATLWEELNTHQPWRNALGNAGRISFDVNETQVKERKLAFIGINTGIGSWPRRDILRRTWVPVGSKLQELEARTGILIRFVVGYSEQRNDADEMALQEEMKQYNDVLRLNMVDSYDALSRKTQRLFTDIPNTIDAHFYFKVDDDVAINVDALAGYLRERQSQPNLYLGCMKSGPVLTDPKYKWYEPDSWRFGDPTHPDGGTNYMRHATGQIYGLSRQVARYISSNSAVLHRFANEDVTLGAWLVGLDIEYVNEKRLCCSTEAECKAQKDDGSLCLGYTEMACAGICKPEERLEPIFKACLNDPLNRNAAWHDS